MNVSDSENQRFIPLISDYGFKVTFGNESNTLFLRRALQALIQSETTIEAVSFLPNETGRLTKDRRGGIYDVACQDAAGNFFIVEMQLGGYPQFIQRMKLYSLFRFNTLVKKGDYTFDKLPRIYCIGILAETILPNIASYYNQAVLRNQQGELIDDQTVFVTVELSKFDKALADIYSDLDKLIYTMKTVHTVTEPIQYPAFWTEEWLRVAIDELDKRNMSPEELLNYEMTLSANALAVHNEKKKIEKAIAESKQETIRKALIRGKISPEEIAEAHDVPLDFVLAIQRQLNPPTTNK